jgi:hypothetical protein
VNNTINNKSKKKQDQTIRRFEFHVEDTAQQNVARSARQPRKDSGLLDYLDVDMVITQSGSGEENKKIKKICAPGRAVCHYAGAILESFISQLGWPGSSRRTTLICGRIRKAESQRQNDPRQ